ncbi:hypothetical protein ACFQ77_31220 [Streptomyces virginiae]|uniref:hypothetical protein n=1 Tax=Streptomyces virginiae TaxID=1961 RepID=UPI0036AAFC23
MPDDDVALTDLVRAQRDTAGCVALHGWVETAVGPLGSRACSTGSGRPVCRGNRGFPVLLW